MHVKIIHYCCILLHACQTLHLNIERYLTWIKGRYAALSPLVVIIVQFYVAFHARGVTCYS